jgi:hypothetical protein
LYSLLCVPKLTKRPADLLWLLGIWVAAGALTAVQILPGLEASGESVRGRGVPYEFATMFSLPPENVLTLLIPRFFGPGISEKGIIYWGRYFMWEMTIFFGVVGLFLAVYGSLCADPPHRRYSVTLSLIFFLLSLGAHTPLFRLLYNYFPGFNKFRGTAKFTFQMTLFLLMLAACGLDALMRESAPTAPSSGKSATSGHAFRPHLGGFIAIAIGILFVVMALSVRSSSSSGGGFIQGWIAAINNTGEAYHPYYLPRDKGFVRQAGLTISSGFLVCAGTCIVLGFFLMVVRFSQKASWAIGFLAILEICIFARTYRPTFDLKLLEPTPLEKQIAELRRQNYGASANEKSDMRILNLFNPNIALYSGLYDIWGNDPGVLQRYAEFIAFTQGENPSIATQILEFKKFPPLLSMLRCGYVLKLKNKNLLSLRLPNPLPQALLLDKYKVLHSRDDIFAAMSEPSFNPREMVILEQEPNPRPVPSREKGTVRVMDFSTDYLTIEAEVVEPSILLLTETYSKGWRVRAPIDGDQKIYRVMPADWTLRAIPLERGHHKFRVEYSPASLKTGVWLSLITAVLLLGGLVCHLYRIKSPAHILPSLATHKPEGKISEKPR